MIRRVSLMACAALALAGCSAAPEFPIIAPTAQVEEVAGTWTRWIEVGITSQDDATVTIAGARIASPMFSTLESIEIDEELPAGETTTLRLPLGTAECPPGLGASSVQVSLVQDGVELIQTAMLPDGALDALSATQCEGQVAGDAVAPSFGTVGAATDGALTTELVLVRGESTEPVEVVAIEGTRVFDVEVADDALPLTMTSAQSRVAIPVTLRLAECEPLSPLDAAGVLTFTVDVRVGGGGEQTMTVAPQGSVKAELEEMLAACES